jgi:hypothetical protein
VMLARGRKASRSSASTETTARFGLAMRALIVRRSTRLRVVRYESLCEPAGDAASVRQRERWVSPSRFPYGTVGLVFDGVEHCHAG